MSRAQDFPQRRGEGSPMFEVWCRVPLDDFVDQRWKEIVAAATRKPDSATTTSATCAHLGYCDYGWLEYAFADAVAMRRRLAQVESANAVVKEHTSVGPRWRK